MLKAIQRPSKSLSEQVRELGSEAAQKRQVLQGLLHELDNRNKIKPIRGKPMR